MNSSTEPSNIYIFALHHATPYYIPACSLPTWKHAAMTSPRINPENMLPIDIIDAYGFFGRARRPDRDQKNKPPPTGRSHSVQGRFLGNDTFNTS